MLEGFRRVLGGVVNEGVALFYDAIVCAVNVFSWMKRGLMPDYHHNRDDFGRF